MDLQNISLIVSSLVAIGTFIILILNTRNKATSEYIDTLEKRIKDLEERMILCEQARDGLADKNNELNQKNTTLLERIVETQVINTLKGKK